MGQNVVRHTAAFLRQVPLKITNIFFYSEMATTYSQLYTSYAGSSRNHPWLSVRRPITAFKCFLELSDMAIHLPGGLWRAAVLTIVLAPQLILLSACYTWWA
jgi:hypothetical protein